MSAMMIKNPRSAIDISALAFRATATRPSAMLAHCPVYQPSPLQHLPSLAAKFAVATIWAKDETQRMRLGSFKALGGAFAIAQMIKQLADVANEDLLGEKALACAQELTFVTASAGNHGLSVAAGARVFGAKSVIVLDASVADDFVARIRAAGAVVERVAGSYEDAVAQAGMLAERHGWILLADGSWPGYVERPALVMEGYTVLAEECQRCFQQSAEWPSHIFLQAGVGGLAAAFAAHVRQHWPYQPEIIVVEPDRAACLLQSMQVGQLTRAKGAASNMGRLDCKDASLIAFDALKHYADAFVTITEEQAEDAVFLLAEQGISTTPSGAAALAAIAAKSPGANAKCLFVATEMA